ncbi:hypothetical protein GOODEAATRI_024884, partial [Goodea atripinnis]
MGLLALCSVFCLVPVLQILNQRASCSQLLGVSPPAAPPCRCISSNAISLIPLAALRSRKPVTLPLSVNHHWCYPVPVPTCSFSCELTSAITRTSMVTWITFPRLASVPLTNLCIFNLVFCTTKHPFTGVPTVNNPIDHSPSSWCTITHHL